MTLPASGPISLGQVNTELSRSATASINLNESALRDLFGVPSGAISMGNGYGKTAVALGFNNGNPFNANNINVGGALSFAEFRNTGVINFSGAGAPTAFTNPTGANLSANFEIRVFCSTVIGQEATLAGVPLVDDAFSPWYGLETTRVLVLGTSPNIPAGGVGSLIGTVYIRNKITLVEISRAFNLRTEAQDA